MGFLWFPEMSSPSSQSHNQDPIQEEEAGRTAEPDLQNVPLSLSFVLKPSHSSLALLSPLLYHGLATL